MSKSFRTLALSVILALLLTVGISAGAFATYNIYAVEDDQITIDGVVTQDEWGEPQLYYYVTKGYESDTDEYITWEYVPGYQPEATFEVYFRYDSDYLYYAMACHGIVPGNNLTAEDLQKQWETDYWKKACSWIGIAMYNDVINNPQTRTFLTAEESRQIWTKLYFSLLDDGTQAACEDIVKGYWPFECEDAGIPKFSEDDYEIVYNEPDLTYDARIPWILITDQEEVGAGDYIVTSVVCKMDHKEGSESGNTLQWGGGVCTDNMTTGGVLGKLVDNLSAEETMPAKTEESNDEKSSGEVSAPENLDGEKAPNQPESEQTVPDAPEKTNVSHKSGTRTMLYVILGVLVVAIIVVICALLFGGKKKQIDNKVEAETENKNEKQS